MAVFSVVGVRVLSFGDSESGASGVDGSCVSLLLHRFRGLISTTGTCAATAEVR